MSVTRTALVGAALTGMAGVVVGKSRSRAARRRITWTPGGGTIHNGALHARILGEGRSGVVLLHGLGGSNAYWGGAYDTLAQTGRLVIPDLLGFGASPRPPSGYTVDDHVGAIISLLDEIGVDGPIVVGAHSLGCLLALALAKSRPHLVAGIVAFCPPLYPDEVTARSRVARLGWLDRQLAINGPWAESVCRWACGHREAAQALAALLRPGIPRSIRRDGFQHTWVSYSETFRHVLAAAEGAGWLAELGVPVELVAGTDDRVVDLAYLHDLADELPYVTLAVRQGAGHDLPLTEPTDAVASLIHATRIVIPRTP